MVSRFDTVKHMATKRLPKLTQGTTVIVTDFSGKFPTAAKVVWDNGSTINVLFIEAGGFGFLPANIEREAVRNCVRVPEAFEVVTK